MNDKKPFVYIASPYSKGDPAMNVHFQCKIFNTLMNDNKVIPVAPLWSHFQHILFPRKYEEWIDYDQSMLHLYDCCLRLDARLDEFLYIETRSSGADAEAVTFEKMKKPVFNSIEALYRWVDSVLVTHE